MLAIAKLAYLKVFLDTLDAVEPLGDAERGRLFTALLQYAKTGEAPRLCGNERFIFPMMRAQIDRDKAELAALSEERSRAGKKGAEAKQAKAGKAKQIKQKLAKPSKSSKDKDEDKEKDKEKDKEISPPIPPSGGRGEGVGAALDDGFRAFWQAYPRQIGKPEAQREWAALCPDADLQEAIQQAVRVHKQSDRWARYGGRYIPAPARWLKEKRWEDTPAPAQSHAGYDMEQLEELSVFSLPENL